MSRNDITGDKIASRPASDEFRAAFDRIFGKSERIPVPAGISLCACMGSIGDDPYCPCEMSRRGLVATNPWTPEKVAELHRALDEFESEGDKP